ncbi:MAG: fibronectin type III domain-containing protein, partial [Akkermansiaceae bacterium]|nr:fibronectin type III domain-containing protein [Akkermansiaceae bacterium]
MPFLALAPVGLRAQDPVLIREVVSREMSIHIGGVETTPQKEIVSRELSFHVENGSSDLVHEVVSREYDVLVDASGTPPAITAVTASLSPTGDSLTLDWSASNPWAVRDIQRFEIYLSDTGPIDGITGLTPHATVGGETTRITLSGLAAYTDHYYAVVAVDGLGNRITTPPARAAYVLMPELVSREMSLFIGQEPEPPFKEVVSREYDLAVVTPEPPPAIADVLMTVSPTGDRVTLDWSSYNQWAVKDIQRFDIYLSDEGSFSTIAGKTPVATAGGGSTSITLTGLTTQRDHHFAVVPVDALGNRIEQVAVSTAYVLMPEIVSREMSLFIGQESEPPYREIVSREMSFVVADGTVPAPVTGIDSGFSAVTSITDEGAVDLDWTAYNELAQRDVSRYRIYVSKNYFDNVTGMNPYQILQDGRQRVTVKGFVGLSIQYFAVVAEDAFGNFDPVVRAFSAQASYAGRPVPLGREYLVNGTAETATTAGWSGQGLVAAAPGSLPGTGLGTRNTLGDFIFAPASGGPLEQILTQRVNLTGVSGLIDAGYQRYSLQALIQSRNAAERAEVELVFRDAVDTVTGRVLLRDDDILSTDWELVEEFGTVPQGSRVVDVILRARRTAGSQTRVGFDNLSFILTNAELLRRVDLDAKVHLPGTPVRLALDPGRYQIRPVQGGRFEAWHGWLGSVGNTGDSGSPDRLDTGWQWSYALASASLPARVVVKSPAAGLFALASRANEVNATAYDFVLREAETLDFYLPHPADSGADNGGGISLIIERLAAQHDAVAHPLGPLAYRSFEDSPFRAVNFAKGRFHLEDAESAPLLAGVAGVTITNNALDGAAYPRRGPG